MKVLLTGFAPFGGESINPSWQAVSALPDTYKGIQLTRVEIPVEYDHGFTIIESIIRSEHPDAVISVGQAGGRAHVSIERIAVNLQDANAPDNAGVIRTDQSIIPDGPAAYFTTLPIKKIVSLAALQNLTIDISNSAGLYVCNDVMYRAAHLAATEFPTMRTGFVHVPYLPEQVAGKDLPAVSLDEDVKALQVVLEALD